MNFDQIQHITLQHSVRYWLLAENADEIDRTLPYCLNAERIYRSVDWQQFQQNSQAKRELWQQIQQILIMMPSLFPIEECDMDRFI